MCKAEPLYEQVDEAGDLRSPAELLIYKRVLYR